MQEAHLIGIDLTSSQSVDHPWVDKGVITFRDSSNLGSFAQSFIQTIAQRCHWEREAVKEQVPA